MRRRNTQIMKLRVLASLLLGCLFVMTAQGDSSATERVIPGQDEGSKNKLEVTGITATMFAQKEPFQRTGAAHTRKRGLGGEKLTTHEESSIHSKNEKGADGGGTSKISGNRDALKSFGSLREQKNDQEEKHMTIMGPKTPKFTSFVIPRRSPSNTNSKCSQDSKAVPVKASLKSSSSSRPERQISEEPHHQGSAQKDETQSLVEAAKEIVNLIHKDYRATPRQKPPINNHEPRN